MKKYNLLFISLFFSTFLFSHEYSIKSISSTSTLIEKDKEEKTYDVSNLLNNSWTSWSEGEADEGIGVKIIVNIDPPVKLSKYNEFIDIVNGYGDLKYFYQNNRVKELRIYFNDNQNFEDIFLYDDWGIQSYSFNIDTVKENYLYKLTFEILSVYKGTKYNDTCLCELFIGDGKREVLADPYYSEILKAYYHNILKDDSKIQTDKNGNIKVFITKRGRETLKEWIYPGKIKDFGDVWYRDNLFLSENLPPIKIIPKDFITTEEETNKFGRDTNLKCKSFDCFIYKNNQWIKNNEFPAMAEMFSFIKNNKGKFFCMRIENWAQNQEVISISVYKDSSDEILLTKYFKFLNGKFNLIEEQ